MNENSERDTHFQEFAELLANDLAALNSRQWKSLDEYMAAKRLLIAQRAYDLVYNSLEFTRTSPEPRTMQLSSTGVWMKFIPDLTEWPDISS